MSNWREPIKHVLINELNKVLIIALIENETNKYNAESIKVIFLKDKGVNSYDYLIEDVNNKSEMP